MLASKLSSGTCQLCDPGQCSALCLPSSSIRHGFLFSDSDGCARLFFLGFFMFLSYTAGDVVTQNWSRFCLLIWSQFCKVDVFLSQHAKSPTPLSDLFFSGDFPPLPSHLLAVCSLHSFFLHSLTTSPSSPSFLKDKFCQILFCSHGCDHVTFLL